MIPFLWPQSRSIPQGSSATKWWLGHRWKLMVTECDQSIRWWLLVTNQLMVTESIDEIDGYLLGHSEVINPHIFKSPMIWVCLIIVPKSSMWFVTVIFPPKKNRFECSKKTIEKSENQQINCMDLSSLSSHHHHSVGIASRPWVWCHWTFKNDHKKMDHKYL